MCLVVISFVLCLVIHTSTYSPLVIIGSQICRGLLNNNSVCQTCFISPCRLDISNNLPINLRLIDSHAAFRCALKTHLLTHLLVYSFTNWLLELLLYCIVLVVCGSVHGFVEPSRPRTGGSGCERVHNDSSGALQCVSLFTCPCFRFMHLNFIYVHNNHVGIV